MSYRQPIGQFEMKRGFRPAPMVPARMVSGSAAAPSSGMTYATQERASVQAPRRSTLTYATTSLGQLRLSSGLRLAPQVAPSAQMSLSSELGRLNVLKMLVAPYAAALKAASLAQNVSLSDRARWADRAKAARALGTMLAAVRPSAQGWIRADVDKLKAIKASGTLPTANEAGLLAASGQEKAKQFAMKIVQAWGELEASLRAGGYWVDAPPPPNVVARKNLTVRRVAPPLQTFSPPPPPPPPVPEEQLAPEVEQPHDATQPMPERPECLRVPAPADCPGGGWTVPASANLLPPEGSGGGGIPWWAWLIGGVAVVGGGVYYATRK